MSDIVQYGERRLERLSCQELMRPEDLRQRLPRFYLSGDVYVGNFNQAGFVIGDRTPERRPGWIGSDFISVGLTEEELMLIPEEERPFHIADLAALRFFAVSEQLMEIFRKDRYLGVPMIRKICEEGVVPGEFNEMPIFPEERDPHLKYAQIGGEEPLQDELATLVNIVLRPLRERTETGYSYFPYVTYFQTQLYPRVMRTLEQSVQEVVHRFDEFGVRFRLSESHKELKINPLLIEG